MGFVLTPFRSYCQEITISHLYRSVLSYAATHLWRTFYLYLLYVLKKKNKS